MYPLCNAHVTYCTGRLRNSHVTYCARRLPLPRPRTRSPNLVLFLGAVFEESHMMLMAEFLENGRYLCVVAQRRGSEGTKEGARKGGTERERERERERETY